MWMYLLNQQTNICNTVQIVRPPSPADVKGDRLQTENKLVQTVYLNMKSS